MQRGVAGPIDGQPIDHGSAHMNVVEADLALLGQNRMDQVDRTAALDEPGGRKRNDGTSVQAIGADQRTAQALQSVVTRQAQRRRHQTTQGFAAGDHLFDQRRTGGIAK